VISGVCPMTSMTDCILEAPGFASMPSNCRARAGAIAPTRPVRIV